MYDTVLDMLSCFHLFIYYRRKTINDFSLVVVPLLQRFCVEPHFFMATIIILFSSNSFDLL